jgi:hypothetical protein
MQCSVHYRKGRVMTKPIPEGYHTLTPYLAVDDASAAPYHLTDFGGPVRRPSVFSAPSSCRMWNCGRATAGGG